MSQRIVIFIGVYLLISVTSGEGNNGTNSDTTSVTEKVEGTTEDTEQPSIVPENSENYLIDRSSHFHHLVHAEHPHHHYRAPAYHGFWKKKFIWRPRWVKTWQEKKVYVAVWKRMWGPAMLNEWVPIPKPPPGWLKQDIGGLVIKTPPY